MAGNKKAKRKSAGVRKTLQCATPVLIRFNRSDDLKLKLEPYQCLEKFKNRTADKDKWFTLLFRTHVGLDLAQTFFNEEAKSMLTNCAAKLNDIQERFTRLNNWLAGDNEIEIIRQGLELTDQMQDQTTRKEQLEIYLRVQKQLLISYKTLIKE